MQGILPHKCRIPYILLYLFGICHLRCRILPLQDMPPCTRGIQDIYLYLFYKPFCFLFIISHDCLIIPKGIQTLQQKRYTCAMPPIPPVDLFVRRCFARCCFVRCFCAVPHFCVGGYFARRCCAVRY